MVKKLLFISFLTFWLTSGIFAQKVILSDQFDSGAGKWSGWINGDETTVTFSVDTNSVLSGKSSYLADITSASATTYFIQRNAAAPLLAGKLYTVSFMAVTDKEGASINVLFELEGSPYTKVLNEIQIIDTTPQVYTYQVPISENIPTNQLKFHYGGTQNDGAKIWIDSVVVTEMADPALVNDWGITSQGTGWPILNDSSTADGAGSIGDPAGTIHAWHSMRGSFGSDLMATTNQAVVVSGQIEWVGGSCGNAYGPIRYALTYMDSTELKYQYTDSAMWISTADSAKNQNKHSGYEFTPRTGTGTMANGGGGGGTVWTVNHGNWNSTWSNNGRPIAAVVQTPRNKPIAAGVYDFKISVLAINDTTNEIRWYLGNSGYWFGGTVIAEATTQKFNGICFSIGDDLEGTGINQFNAMNVRAELGDPIDVPEPIWEGYYVNEWGITSQAKGWPILNDSSTVDGNASMGDAAGTNPTSWMSIRGGFGQDLSLKTDEAFIVKGKLEWVGGSCGNAYGPIRYALTYMDSTELKYQWSDSAIWTSTADSAKNQNKHSGYEFTPITGTGTMSNGGGGGGTVWTVNYGNWNSTWSNHGKPIAAVRQKPRNKEIAAGIYDFFISVRQVSDTENEVTWYLGNDHYWFGGTVTDTATTNKFNGICFGLGDDLEDTGINQFNVIDCFVDFGTTPVVPTPPWEDFYVPVDLYGVLGDRNGGWSFVPGDVDGNAGVAGDAALTDWVAIQGGFGQDVDIEVYPDKTLQIQGKMELVGGGFEAQSSLRFGLFHSDSAGSVEFAETDSAAWTGVDSHHTGYLFCAQSADNAMPNWQATSKAGNWGAVVDDTWLSTNGANSMPYRETPVRDNAAGTAGTYNFAIAVTPMGSGMSDVRFKLEKDGYFWGAQAIDSAQVTTVFNNFCVALNAGNASTTALNLIDVQVVQLDTTFVDGIVDEAVNSSLPKNFELSQNYPNPFNPSTTVQFALPKSSEVELVIHNILGQVVAKIASGKYEAGYHKVTINASHLATGIYFIRMKAGDFVSVKKAMLLK